ncbi:MAG: SDR family oxidoreductase [Aquabacterium sp.]|jgi:short-subunit dehydrogenase|nr:MAG: SDR family oxidoreductase [Aquabacterium sp.]TAL23401.1 MAG: SDR family oxidoreductase [Aquabacterium sp.]
MKTEGRTALITGASAGIGATFARHLAAEGYDLVLVARRADRLQALAAELSREHGVRCELLSADLADPASPRKVAGYVAQLGLRVDFLVNNAGLSGHSKFVAAPWEQQAGEIQLMVTTLTELIHLLAPAMIERGWGRIVNVSSLAALAPPGESLLYSAIKSYVLVMSQSLDMEFKPHGVHVTALCPGFTWSEFHDVMGTRGTASRLPGFLWQQPQAVVREACAAVMRGKPVCVPGLVNKVVAAFTRPLPLWLQYRLGSALNPFK